MHHIESSGLEQQLAQHSAIDGVLQRNLDNYGINEASMTSKRGQFADQSHGTTEWSHYEGSPGRKRP